MSYKKLTILYFLGFFFLSSNCQAQATEKRKIYFEISNVETKNDTSIVIPLSAQQYAIEAGSAVTAYQKHLEQSSGASGDREFIELGTGRVIKKEGYIICFIKLFNDKQKLQKGDFVELEVSVPVLKNRTVLSDIVFNNIILTDNSNNPLFTLDEIINGDGKVLQDSIYARMSNSIKAAYEVVKNRPQGIQLSKKLDAGNMKGFSVMDKMKSPTTEDLESYLYYLYSFPVKYMGKNFRASESYAAWLVSFAPKAHKEIQEKLFPIHTNTIAFAKGIAKYKDDIVSNDHAKKIILEATKLIKNDSLEKARLIADFGKAIAYAVNDTVAKASYWIIAAEILQNEGNYNKAIIYCDSSIYYAQKANHYDYELQAMGKKLYCSVYALQYKEAIAFAIKYEQRLEKLKDKITRSDYFRSVRKKLEYQGIAYYNNGDYNKALPNYNKIIELNNEENTYDALYSNGSYLKKIGKIKNEQGLHDDALNYFNKSLRIYKQNQDTTNWGDLLSDLAFSYYKKGDYNQSLLYCDSGINLSRRVNDDNNIGYLISLEGNNYWQQGLYEKAIEAHESSIAIRRKINDNSGQADSWENIGELYLKSGRKTLALAAFDSAAARYKVLNNNNALADIYNRQGNVFANDDNKKEAVQYYEKAIGVSTKSTEFALYNLADAWNGVDNAKAKKYFDACINSCKESNNLSLEFDATRSFAMMNYENGDTKIADKLYITCLQLRDKLATIERTADCLVLKGYGLETQALFDSAVSYYKKAISIYDSVNQSSAVYSLARVANVYTITAEFSKAITVYEQAIQLAKEIDNQLAYGYCLSSSTFVYGLVGESNEGLKNSDSAIYIFTKSGNGVQLANTYVSRGTLLESVGRYSEAIAALMQADSIYEAQGLRESRSTVYTNTGVVYFKQGDLENTFKYHRLAADMLDKKVINENYMLSMGNIAESLVYLKRYSEAEKELLRLVPIAKEKKINRILSGLYTSLGKSYYETGKFVLSEKYYTEAYSLSKISGEKQKTIEALTQLGSIAIIDNKVQKAQTYFSEAANLTEKYNIATGWESYYQLGLLFYQQKKFDSSIVYFKKAASQLDKNTENLYGGESARKIYNNDPRKSDLYDKLTFAYYNLGDIKEAWNYANRSNIAGIKELSGSIESSGDTEKNDALKKLLALQQQKIQLEKTLVKQDGAARLETIKKIEIKEKDYNSFLMDAVSRWEDLGNYFSKSNADEFNNYKGKLPDDVAVLLYVQNNNTLMIFSLTNEKLSVDTMTVDVNARVDNFIKAIKNTGISTGTGALSLRSEPVDEEEVTPAADFKSQSAALYNILINTIEDKIKNKKKLCIIPSGIFSNLPFQCLGKQTSTASFKFLIEDYNVFYTNKMSVFNNAARTASVQMDKNSFAGFGVPDSLLTYNIIEVTEIGKILKAESAVYTDTSATESLAKKLLLEKQYIHFATHGVLNYSTDYSQSYLKLLPDHDTTTGNQGKLTMKEILTLGIKDCNMVILSACQTAVSTQLVKGWNISPANSFLVSNVKTVVASLWKVADEPTGILMKYFYENLSKPASMNKLDALRQAQIKLSQHPKFSHPNYWGAFVLYGDWQ